MDFAFGSHVKKIEITRANTILCTLGGVLALGFAMAFGHALAVWNVANDCKRLAAFHVGSSVFDCRQR
jgi:hypothetical protein